MLSNMLDALYFCATWMKMNALKKFQKILGMAKIFRQQKFVAGINY